MPGVCQMQLAQKKANLSDCPDVSEEAKKVLGAARASHQAGNGRYGAKK